MNHQNWPRYAVIAGLAAVGLYVLGVPLSYILIGAVVLACPVMMLFMHRLDRRQEGQEGPGERRGDPPEFNPPRF